MTPMLQAERPSSGESNAPAPAEAGGRRRRAAKLVLAGVLALAVGVLIEQLWAGTPIVGRTLLVYPVAILAALAWLGLELLRARIRAPVAAGCLAAALYLSNFAWLGTADSAAARLLPFAVLRYGTLSLDPVAPSPPLPYWVGVRNGRLWSEYPVTAAVLALPVFLPAALGKRAPGAVEPEKLSAALMAAISVGFVLAALRRLGCSLNFSLFATALYAFASSILSIASQALWQHGPGAMALAGMIWSLAEASEDRRSRVLAGFFGGLAVAARPTNALVVAPVLVALLLREPRRALAFALGALGPVGLVAAYDTYAFGAPWRTGYGLVGGLEWTTPRLFEVLLSPTRGLLAFTPWIVFSFAGFALGRRNWLSATLAGGAGAGIIVAASWVAWHGGWCYGPRLLTDLMPLFTVGLAPLAPLRAPWLRASIAACGIAAALLHGLYVFHPRSAAARRVVELEDGAKAMEWARHPAAALLGFARPAL
jgi:hypothetical protein